jgi:hypothetical protein
MEGLELHHIIFKSKAPYMANVPVNFIYLIPEEHRGKNGPHHNRKKDLELKLMLQVKLRNKFSNSHYTLEQIKEILGVSTKIVERIVKPLKITKDGYLKEDIILRMMGGRFY